MQTLSITDYKLINPTLAKVMVSYTGKHTKETIRASLAEHLKFLAAPVENSFRRVNASASVGFVRANREVRPVTAAEIRAGYRVMSSNIIMDNHDKTLWEVKSGVGGQYLARHGNEDLSELVEASTYHGRQDVPKVHQLTIGQGRVSELAAFVTDTGDTDYGFITRTAADKCQVLSRATRSLVTVPNVLVAGFYNTEIDPQVHKNVMTELRASLNAGEKAAAVDYWRTLYSYDPAYMDEMIRAVEEDTVA